MAVELSFPLGEGLTRYGIGGKDRTRTSSPRCGAEPRVKLEFDPDKSKFPTVWG